VDNPDTNTETPSSASMTTEISGDSRRTTRRGILALLGIGGATAIVGTTRANAQTEGAEPTDTTDVMPISEAEPTDGGMSVDATAEEPTLYATGESTGAESGGEATPPPNTIQPEDRPLLAAAKVLELTIAEVFETINGHIGDLGLDDAGVAFFATLVVNHRAYAEALSAAHGPGAPKTSNPALFEKFGGEVFKKGTAAEVLAACTEVEHHAADTHLALTGLLLSTDAAALVASILTIEARQAVVLELLQGKSYASDALAVEDAAEQLSLAEITGGN